MEGMLNYFVPEDGDSSDHMNVLPLPRVDQLRLLHVKKSFPLPGDFHFRFKAAFEGTYVWLDLVNDQDVVPDYNGLIVSKVSRVQSESATRPVERVAAKTASPPAPIKAPDLIETNIPETPTAKRSEPQAPAKVFNDDLVGLLADPVPTTSSAVPTPAASPAPVQTTNPVAPDPFNLFMGGAAPMRPMPSPPMHQGSARGPPGSVQGGAPGGFGGNPGYSQAPMGAPRPQGSMNISQMHMGMTPPGHPQQPQQQNNSFQGLQWQGMGQNQQQGGMNQQQRRQW